MAHDKDEVREFKSKFDCEFQDAIHDICYGRSDVAETMADVVFDSLSSWALIAEVDENKLLEEFHRAFESRASIARETRALADDIHRRVEAVEGSAERVEFVLRDLRQRLKNFL